MINLAYLPVVFLSCGEPNADENLARAREVLGPDREIISVVGADGVNEGHAQACEAALLAGAKHCIIIEADNWLLSSARDDLQLRLTEDGLDIHGWKMPRRVQAYLTYGGVSGWVTSHGGIKVVYCDPEWFRKLDVPDFSSLGGCLYSTVPSVLSVERFNTDPWSAFRTGFKEAARALRDRSGVRFKEVEQVKDAGVKWRQNLWMWTCVGSDQPSGYWCQAGALSALELWVAGTELVALDWDRFRSPAWGNKVAELCAPILRASPSRSELEFLVRSFNMATGLNLRPLSVEESESFKSNYLGLNPGLYR